MPANPIDAEPARTSQERTGLWRRLVRRDAWQDALFHELRRLRVGHLTIHLPDGTARTFAGAQETDTLRGVVQIHHPRLFRRIILTGANGAAEAFMDGDWSTPDLAALLRVLSSNDLFQDNLDTGVRPVALLHWLSHLVRPNSRRGSRRNIASHYDLGNDFFGAWLDASMTYSSALFHAPDQDLEAAQHAKYRRMVEQLDIQPGQRVLEIGCGWGGFAEFVARERDCHVTALTISRRQFEFAEARIARAGLSDRVEVRFQDYRDVEGTFDRIASIEMLEAVGERYWPVYFGCLHDRLAPGGIAAVQVITIDPAYYRAYRRRPDFIQRFIFPGGMLPSAEHIDREVGAAGLKLEDVHFFGQSYARTLQLWAERFRAAWPSIATPGLDDRFRRLWEYYLAYCEAGFRTGVIDVGQFRIRRT